VKRGRRYWAGLPQFSAGSSRSRCSPMRRTADNSTRLRTSRSSACRPLRRRGIAFSFRPEFHPTFGCGFSKRSSMPPMRSTSISGAYWCSRRSALQPGGEGVRVIECLDGVEGQCWDQEVWWRAAVADSPGQRAAGCCFSVARRSAPTVLPPNPPPATALPWLARPWTSSPTGRLERDRQYRYAGSPQRGSPSRS